MAGEDSRPGDQLEDGQTQLELEPGAPQPFAFGEAPGPQTEPAVVRKPRKTGIATHTGTDPHGRAVGPAEDHTKPKLDAEGRTLPEAVKAAEKAAAKQRKAAETSRGGDTDGSE